MSWSNFFGFSGSKNKQGPVLNALELQRLKQIESLRTFHPSVIEIQKNVKFKITILIEEKPLSLHVFLPPNFPNEIPVVTVSPAVTHPWISNEMVVTGCQSLNQFYMHSNLGRALQDVCKELVEHRPTFVLYDKQPVVSSPAQSYVSPAQDIQSVSTTLVETENTGTSSSNLKLEGFLKISQMLDNCSIEELRDLDKNPEKLMKLIFDADLISSSAKNREEQMLRNEEIARENIQQKPRLYAARQRLVDKYQELSQLRAEFDRWSLTQNDLLETRTLDNLHTALQLGVSEMDEKSEQIAEQFLNENVEIEEFVRSFTEKRKLTHMRHWKQENVLRI